MPVVMLMFILFISISSCVYNKGKDPGPKQNDSTDTVSYMNDIKPIMEMKCYYQDAEGNGNCHGPEHPGSQQFTTWENITQSAGGSYINKISGSINHKPGFQPMPLTGPKLPQHEIDKIDKWIAEGYVNN